MHLYDKNICIYIYIYMMVMINWYKIRETSEQDDIFIFQFVQIYSSTACDVVSVSVNNGAYSA